LVKFQRTRGVLRLMAAVIHSLWEKGDKNPLILPANIPIDDQRVQFELTRYLSDNWVPILEKDIDGANSLPLRLDGEVPNLGKFAACRRVARTIYLGSAPSPTAANRGIEDRRVKLGCVMLRKMGDFNRVHPMPGSSADVPDDLDARLVVLGIQHTYSKDVANAAETAAKAIFETRGNAPRIYRNTIVFLAADKTGYRTWTRLRESSLRGNPSLLSRINSTLRGNR
jgi:hypothetical protein